jgi:Fe-S cluster assembly iron-binding protein IscA
LVRVLEITQGAVAVLKDLRASTEIPDDADARIQVVTNESGESIGLMFTDGPQEGDQVVVEEGDLKVLVAGELAETLEQSVLDVRTSEAGTQLELRERESGISTNGAGPHT